ncbi:MAG: DUF4241 domain-containing protein [Clostridia bacterium]|nr:DUF4241 domain-containing protein [Clostridia bacterium]
MKNLNYVGDFKIESGQIIVTDPCYRPYMWCNQIIDAVNGTYEAYVGDDCSELVVILKSSNCDKEYEKKEIENLAVDSGKMGVFDFDYFFNASIADQENNEKRNSFLKYCRETIYKSVSENKERAGVIEYGAVSDSGYGDGIYKGIVYKNKDGLVERIEIIFID